MPGFDGTGPSKNGPITGKGNGFCILKTYLEKSEKIEGYIGSQIKPYVIKTKISGLFEKLLNLLPKGGKNMPRRDETGPNSMGPMTGRCTGNCTGFSASGSMNNARGRGLGLGRSGRKLGQGRGYRNMYNANNFSDSEIYNSDFSEAMTVSQELEVLKNHKKSMQNNINAINEKIHELEKINSDEENK